MIKLAIGAPLKEVACHNVYKLVVEFMHGDADAYTKTEYFYNEDRLEELTKDVAMLELCEGWDWEDHLDDFAEQVGLSSDELETWEDKFRECDATNDCNTLAAPSVSELTYFGDEGTEYKVDIIK